MMVFPCVFYSMSLSPKVWRHQPKSWNLCSSQPPTFASRSALLHQQVIHSHVKQEKIAIMLMNFGRWCANFVGNNARHFWRFLANVESVAQSTCDHLPLIQRHLDTERLSPATVQAHWDKLGRSIARIWDYGASPTAGTHNFLGSRRPDPQYVTQRWLMHFDCVVISVTFVMWNPTLCGFKRTSINLLTVVGATLWVASIPGLFGEAG